MQEANMPHFSSKCHCKSLQFGTWWFESTAFCKAWGLWEGSGVFGTQCWDQTIESEGKPEVDLVWWVEYVPSSTK
jgi:hypothetical protein